MIGFQVIQIYQRWQRSGIGNSWHLYIWKIDETIDVDVSLSLTPTHRLLNKAIIHYFGTWEVWMKLKFLRGCACPSYQKGEGKRFKIIIETIQKSYLLSKTLFFFHLSFFTIPDKPSTSNAFHFSFSNTVCKSWKGEKMGGNWKSYIITPFHVYD